MLTFILEGNKIKSREDFHEEISKLLEFPHYYGKNLDAFWECLSECASDWKNDAVSIEWLNHLETKKFLGVEYFEDILDIFKTFTSLRKKDFSLILK